MTLQQKQIGEAFRVRSYFGGMNGLGDVRPITSAIGAGLLSAGGVIAAIPALQLPGAIVAAVGALTGLIGLFFQPDVTKIQATAIVDQIEAQVLKPNLAGWQALPANQKTRTMQAAFLEVFDAAFNKVRQACSNPALGTAGQNCISERVQGACHWTVDGRTPGNPPDCGNWYVWFRDPIANDLNVIPDAAVAPGSVATGSVTGAVDSAVSSVSAALGGVSPIAIGLGLVALAFMVSD